MPMHNMSPLPNRWVYDTPVYNFIPQTQWQFRMIKHDTVKTPIKDYAKDGGP